TASEEFTLGGMYLLTKKDEARNLSINESGAGWTVFTEHIEAPKTGRIFWLDKLAELKATKKDDPRNGFWLSTLQNDEKNQTFACAALKGELWPSSFEWRNVKDGKANFSIRSGSRNGLEKIKVPVGNTVSADAVMVGFWGDRRPTQTLAEVGRIMGESVRQGRPMRTIEPGWSSWHSYSRSVTAEAVLKAARCMKDELYDAGYRYIQIDGGWWTRPGSYFVNEDFSRGIRDLSNQVTDMGLKFGLHISPLRVNPTDPFLKKHTDWIMQPYGRTIIDPDDDEMITNKGMIYLDGSHPDVPPYLAGQFRQLVEDYRPTFMKWDHHYGGLEEGDRFDPTMTGLQAHNKAIRLIRSVLPEELVVTRSMGWLYGAIECYDAVRVGNDINHPGVSSKEEPYANITFGKTTGTIDDVLVGKDYKGMIRFARSIAQNYYIHNNIAICDPDAFFATPQYTLEEARCHITLQALMGGFIFGGDRIESLPQERLDLYRHKPLLDVWSNHQHAVPLDLFSGADVPRIWKLELDDRIVFGLYNWMDDAADTTWSLEDLELDSADYTLTDLWSGKPVSFGKKGLSLSMEPHSVRLIEFK
ncbi:MAG: alpha-galactosidase, partial [Pontiella sp.]|nr:alpha-galactosidase [Pontiella sp.]